MPINNTLYYYYWDTKDDIENLRTSFAYFVRFLFILLFFVAELHQ